MYLAIISKEEVGLANIPQSVPGVLRPLALPFGQKVFSFCIPRDRWDKEFFKLQGG